MSTVCSPNNGGCRTEGGVVWSSNSMAGPEREKINLTYNPLKDKGLCDNNKVTCKRRTKYCVFAIAVSSSEIRIEIKFPLKIVSHTLSKGKLNTQ